MWGVFRVRTNCLPIHFSFQSNTIFILINHTFASFSRKIWKWKLTDVQRLLFNFLDYVRVSMTIQVNVNKIIISPETQRTCTVNGFFTLESALFVWITEHYQCPRKPLICLYGRLFDFTPSQLYFTYIETSLAVGDMCRESSVSMAHCQWLG